MRRFSDGYMCSTLKFIERTVQQRPGWVPQFRNIDLHFLSSWLLSAGWCTLTKESAHSRCISAYTDVNDEENASLRLNLYVSWNQTNVLTIKTSPFTVHAPKWAFPAAAGSILKCSMGKTSASKTAGFLGIFCQLISVTYFVTHT